MHVSCMHMHLGRHRCDADGETGENLEGPEYAGGREQLAMAVYYSGYGPRKFQARAETGGGHAKARTMCHTIQSSAPV